MTQSLPQELETYIQEKLSSGEFCSRDELEREAIRVYRELELRHAELRSKIAERIRLSDAGKSGPLDVEEIKDRARRAIAE